MKPSLAAMLAVRWRRQISSETRRLAAISALDVSIEAATVSVDCGDGAVLKQCSAAAYPKTIAKAHSPLARR